MADPLPRSRPPEPPSRRSPWRFVPYLTCGVVTATALVGWYDSRVAADAERGATEQRLATAEQRLAETKGDLDHCKSWMDALMAQASAAPDPAPRAPTPPAPAAQAAPATPSASGSAEPAPDDVAQGLSNGDDALLVQRRRRMLEMRGQLNSVEAHESAP